MSFVRQELFQLIEAPASQVVVLSGSSGEIPLFKTDASQILKYEKRIFAVFLDECLRNLMVYIRHPTVLSSRDGLESTLCRLSSLGLELSPYFLEFMAFDGNLFTRDELGLALFVVTDGKETESAVNADEMTNVLLPKVINNAGHRDMEIP